MIWLRIDLELIKCLLSLALSINGNEINGQNNWKYLHMGISIISILSLNVENQYYKYYSLIINLHIFERRTLIYQFIHLKLRQLVLITLTEKKQVFWTKILVRWKRDLVDLTISPPNDPENSLSINILFHKYIVFIVYI